MREDIIYLMLLMGRDWDSLGRSSKFTRGGNKRRVGLAGPAEATHNGKAQRSAQALLFFCFGFFFGRKREGRGGFPTSGTYA